jgi:DNA repair protein RadC
MREVREISIYAGTLPRRQPHSHGIAALKNCYLDPMKVEDSIPSTIKNWSPADRPREKLLMKGTSALSDAELVAILLGSGTSKMSAVELARQVLTRGNNRLEELARLTVRDLMKIKGIGEAKAISIVAALELGRRRKEADPGEKPKITTSHDAFDLLQGDLMDLLKEEFWILCLNRAHRVIAKRRISEGGVSGTVADPKVIYRVALEEWASGIIVAHNHPSGNLQPSNTDIELTKKLKEAGKFLEVQLLDHLIIANQKYFSFADEGMIG